jgi:hypothetical protein
VEAHPARLDADQFAGAERPANSVRSARPEKRTHPSKKRAKSHQGARRPITFDSLGITGLTVPDRKVGNACATGMRTVSLVTLVAFLPLIMSFAITVCRRL